MFTKKIIYTVWILVVGMLLLSACQPGAGNDVVTMNKNGSTEVSSANGGSSSNQPGSSDPATAVGGSNTGMVGQATPGAGVGYTDATYKFLVTYPSNYVIRPQTADQFAGLNPVPVSVILFMNPTAAASSVPNELGDLEVRIYSPAGNSTLDRWLTSVGLSDGRNTQSFKTDNISGTEVCESTMIFPECRYYVMGSDWVYQLTPTSNEGEAMFQSFKLVP